MAAALSIPIEPDRPDARELLLDELSDPIYAESQPNWFDLLSQGVLDWLGSLRLAEGSGVPAFAFLVGTLVLAAAIATALLVYGLPRWRGRSRSGHEIFGERDGRTARQLRRDAERAAAAGDWSRAIADRYRAIARSLDERTLVAVLPGTTAHGFARAAGRLYPEQATALDEAATRFDEVRYVGHTGTRQDYLLVRSVDDTLAAAPAVLPEPVGEVTR